MQQGAVSGRAALDSFEYISISYAMKNDFNAIPPSMQICYSLSFETAPDGQIVCAHVRT